MVNRREFLETVAIGTLLATGGPSGSGEVAAPEPQGWYDRPMRWAQLAFVEDDPGNFDPDFWLDYFRRIHADAACLSAGGCVAFYPTHIPLHYRSKWLGNTDPFGDMVKGCRALEMNVIGRTDPHAVHQDVYDAHPDWVMVDAEGRKQRHTAAAHVGSRLLAYLRPRPLPLRVHDYRDEGDREALPRRRDLLEPMGRFGHVLLHSLSGEFPGLLRNGSATNQRPAESGATPVHRLVSAAALRAVAPLGFRD
jgi:Hypothetical glycosyl hydrolase 6